MKADESQRAPRRSVRSSSSIKSGFAHSGAAGANSFKFSGRIGGKALAPGSYRLVGKRRRRRPGPPSFKIVK